MPVITVIIILAVIGILMWAINTYVPMADPWKKLLNVVAVIATILWLLNVFGVFGYLGDVNVGHVGHVRH